MEITDFTHNHIEQALSLAEANYEEERQHVPILPPIDSLPGLTRFPDNGLGVAASENGNLLGFLCCYSPLDNAFGIKGIKGTFSPVHAHGTVHDNRDMIYKRLYQAAAEKWVEKGIISHAAGLYAHDAQAINSFFVNGFGLRTVDAIRPMEKIQCPLTKEYVFKELDPDCKADTLPLKNMLIRHLGNSPTFMSVPQMDENDIQKQYDRRKPRYFTAYLKDELIAWIEVIDSGENFACDHNSMQNICGAFCLPEHRGKGMFQNLLNCTIAILKSEDYTRLGVDFEGFNLNAYGFWLKYFTAYTNGVVRRIDEQVLEVSA